MGPTMFVAATFEIDRVNCGMIFLPFSCNCDVLGFECFVSSHMSHKSVLEQTFQEVLCNTVLRNNSKNL